jgi:hypothetical protein
MDSFSMETLAPKLSYFSLGLLVLATAAVVVGLLVPVSKRAIKWIAFTGLATASGMGIISGVLYIWHHYYR